MYILSFFTTPIGNTFTRTQEFEADIFGINASRQPDGEAEVDVLLGEYPTRYCLSISDIRLFTSQSYLQELLPPQSPRAYVTPATWLNEDWILGDEEAKAAWAAKHGDVRLLFAARLDPRKGVAVLLSAIEAASAAGAAVDVWRRGSRDS